MQRRQDEMISSRDKADADRKCDLAMLVFEDAVELIIQILYYYYKNLAKGERFTFDFTLSTSISVTVVHIIRQLMEIIWTTYTLPAMDQLMPRYMEIKNMAQLKQFEAGHARIAGKEKIIEEIREIKLIPRSHDRFNIPTKQDINYPVADGMLKNLDFLRKITFGKGTHTLWSASDWETLRKAVVKKNKKGGLNGLEYLAIQDIRNGDGIIEMALLASQVSGKHSTTQADETADAARRQTRVYAGNIVTALADLHRGALRANGGTNSHTLQFKAHILEELMKWGNERSQSENREAAVTQIVARLHLLFPGKTTALRNTKIDLSGLKWNTGLIKDLVEQVRTHERKKIGKKIDLVGSILGNNLLRIKRSKNLTTLTVMEQAVKGSKFMGPEEVRHVSLVLHIASHVHIRLLCASFTRVCSSSTHPGQDDIARHSIV